MLSGSSRAEATPLHVESRPMRDSNAPHPMHTSFTVLTHAANGTLTATIRVFADDLAQVLGRDVMDASASLDARVAARLSTYLATRFVIVGRDGRRIALGWCGAKRVGDLLWLCLAAPAVASLRGATVSNGILLEHFADQVNIVQVQYADRRHSMLFSRAEAPKRLP